MKVQIHIIMASVLIIYGKDPNFNTFLTPTTIIGWSEKLIQICFFVNLKRKNNQFFINIYQFMYLV